MASSMLHGESRRLYSWWWDSHISPKNSRWLQDNLTDMDAKVKAMIKLIEIDADSFAKRADMYYKQRPELMKLVEEFYRAYRALAERYNQATGDLRQAQKQMAEAFPDQVPFGMADDSPTGSSVSDGGPHTPEMPHPLRALLDPGDFSLTGKEGLKILNEMFGPEGVSRHAKFGEGKVRKGLKFHDEDADHKSTNGSGDFSNHDGQNDVSELSNESHNVKNRIMSESEEVGQAEIKIQTLTEALAKLEAETEASLLQYRQSLDRLCSLEADVSRAHEDSKGLTERADKAESEVESLKQSLARLEDEKEAGLLQYQHCLDIISNLERKISLADEEAGRLSQRASEAVAEVQFLKQALAKLESEKEAGLVQIQKYLEMISYLEMRVSQAEENVERLNGQASEAENETQRLKEDVAILKSEKEACLVQYNQSLETISNLETRISQAEDDAEVVNGRVTKAEATAQTLKEALSISELDRESSLAQYNQCLGTISDLEIKLRRAEEDALRLSERAEKGESDVQSLNQLVATLQEEKETAALQYLSCLGTISDLENDLIGAQDEVKNLRNEIAKVVSELHGTEKHNLHLENSLSDMNAQVEGLRAKVKVFEGSCLSLQEEKLTLVAEKSSLVSQLEIVMEKVGRLSEKNSLLEVSLSAANVELDGLRNKSNSLEESYRSVDSERAVLLTERDTLLSNLESIQRRLEVLESNYAELEENYSNLKKEKISTIQQVEELRKSLNLEKQEHANFVQSSETRLARLEDQIVHVQEEGCWRKKEFEDEQDKAIKAQVEIFILQRSIQDMEEKNFSLMIECQKYYDASKLSEKVISQLEQESFEQHVEMNSLINQLEILRMGLYEILRSLEVETDRECEDDKLLLQKILQKIDDVGSSLLASQEENQELLFEKFVLETLLGQLRLEAVELESTKDTVDQELKMRSEELTRLQDEKQELLEMNGQLRVEVREGEQRENGLKVEMDHLHTMLSDLQEEHLVLQCEYSSAHEENKSLAKECSETKEKKCLLEEENSVILEELLTLGNLFSISKSHCAEKDAELERLCNNLDQLREVKHKLGMENITIGEKLETVETDKIHLQTSVLKLEDELSGVKNVNSQLRHELLSEKDMVNQKDTELLEAEHKLLAAQSDNVELLRNIEELKKENDMARLVRMELENQNFKQLEENTHQIKEIRSLREAHDKFESDLAKLHEEVNGCKTREAFLSVQLQNEIQAREAEAAEMFSELQISTICSQLFENKVHEAFAANKNLEGESILNQAEIEHLKERLRVLEGESAGLKSNLAAYSPVIVSLRDSVTCLEDHALSQAKSREAGKQIQDEEFADSYYEPNGITSPEDHALSQAQSRGGGKQLQIQDEEFAESCDDPNDDQNLLVVDGVSELKELQARVKLLEKALVKMVKLSKQEALAASARLETALKDAEELRSKSSIIREIVQTSGVTVAMHLENEELDNEHGNVNAQKAEAETSKVRNSVSMKDIPLDQMSECSSYDHGFGSHGVSRRENAETDDQMLELWETSDHDYSIDTIVNKPQKMKRVLTRERPAQQQIIAVDEQRSRNPSSEFEVEKELRVDSLAVSKRITVPRQDANKRKILERLSSDSQKLMNLQITIQDLRKKIEKSKKSKKSTKFIEYNNVKEQLQLVEEATMQLVDVNGTLIKNAEQSPLPSDRRGFQEPEETAKLQRRRVSEQAREGSEKVGQLELEMQKIQFILLKLEGENDVKGINVAKKSTGVLLRDYISGGVRGSSQGRKKKIPCCACVKKPSTKDE
ncbi:protein NETWORKED 1A-like isoform X2 [Papaver somniferum]|uniref:protein NETWORKED 1A-like isoform X2 n=1 Tax=Papaver somniferum TaxID=3469 RepID=UPI000E70301A|nr:protein NETWORKED 1A-like isoform X2 [Papaver somniferum]